MDRESTGGVLDKSHLHRRVSRKLDRCHKVNTRKYAYAVVFPSTQPNHDAASVLVFALSFSRLPHIMSSKRKWDQAGPDGDEADGPSAKATKVEEGKTASEAAAAAAAIAAKIAAQFASTGGAAPSGTKDPHDGEFTHDIDINDVRNRYLLTKGSTQTEVRYRTTIPP